MVGLNAKFRLEGKEALLLALLITKLLLRATNLWKGCRKLALLRNVHKRH